MKNNRHIVLLVDDSIDDRLFMRKALERSSGMVVAAEVSDGQEAIDYLKGEGPFQDRSTYPWPDVMFVDLKMPRKNGFDVLCWVKDELSHKPKVIIVSGACLEDDVTKSLALGAMAYFKKTSVRQEQEEMLRRVEGLLVETKGLSPDFAQMPEPEKGTFS